MKIGIVGAAGRMGRMLIAEVLGVEGCQLAGGTEPPGSGVLGQDLGLLIGAAEQGLSIGDDTGALFKASDAVVDFTHPDATVRHAALSGETGVALIVGTTGLEAQHMEALGRAAAKAAVVQAANMSVGVNLLLGLTAQVASALGDDYDIEIAEMHHRHKVDAPSGTSLALGSAAAAGAAGSASPPSLTVTEEPMAICWAGQMTIQTLAAIVVPSRAPKAMPIPAEVFQ